MNNFFGIGLVSIRKRAVRPFYIVQRGGVGIFPCDVGLALPHFSSKILFAWLSKTLMHMHDLSIHTHGYACVRMLRVHAIFFFSKNILKLKSSFARP